MSFHFRSLFAFLLLTLLMQCEQPLFAQTLNENQLKANYLIGFIDFLHWGRTGQETYVIGLVGRGSLERELQAIAERNLVSNSERTFVVKRVTDSGQFQHVDVLFFDSDSLDAWPQLLPIACERGILTVGDGDGFLPAGGMIEFRIVRNRLRFALNHGKADACGIGFNARLARLAINEEP